ncbi:MULTISPECIES: SixA phosphatase family protein [Nitrospirillum]|uniref:Phosphohistidine phosphatase n=1 Tax=Nitrospirillum amazonense TaxID=28077 RepID=A0A560GDF8_9PROT|nr:histidine phosphatase family protein [Nitrospirillum amazonense]MEC4591880.1 histidine phosphatase family protein [Nitrospirillum amazonense]TWB31849.1 phosphohistidine phosphatase [Nitrospirillum amazonense]
MKTLFLLRHMKSSWDDDSVPDHERPLSPRGERALTTMADYFRRRKGGTPQPDLILCSTAARTRATLAGLLPLWRETPPMSVDRVFYMASARALADRLRALADPTATVLLIGHNPGLEELALDLVQAEETPLRTRIMEKYPTGALARLEFPLDRWADLAAGTGRLAEFVTPREVAPA